jgi:hypothetical protein
MSVNIKDASNANVAIASATLNSAEVQQIGWAKASRSDTFTTAPTNGTAVDVSSLGMTKFGLQVKKTGSVTSYTVVLQVSLDGTNYVDLLTIDSASDADGAIVWAGTNLFPALYFRSRCSAITLGAGTNVIATIVGMP